MIQGLGGLPEGRIEEVWIDVSEIGVVQEIEGLGAELKSDFVVEVKLAVYRNIQLRRTEAAHKVPGCITGVIATWKTEGCRIDGASAWVIRSI
jgi:hypothetical protein